MRATAHRPDLRWPLPAGLQQRLTGARVTGFRRRGKYILMRLDGGDSRAAASRHVRPHGARPRCGPTMPTPHEHLVLETDDGWRVGFVDPRRFGSVDLVPDRRRRTRTGCWRSWAPSRWTPRSPRPACPPRWPASARRSRRRCWTRRSSPGSATSTSARRCSARGSARCARPTPSPARAPRGWCRRSRRRCARRSPPADPSLRDYVQPDGELGYFQHAWKVYGREGEACERCPGRPACSGDPPHHPVGAQHVLLPAYPAIATSRPPPTGERRWPTTRTSSSRRMAGSG